MAETYNALSAGAMCDAIEAYCGGTLAANVALADLQRGYRRFRQGSSPGSRVIHHWSFVRAVNTITVGGAVTGTATNVTGTLTATASIFNQSMVGQTITVTDYTGTTDLDTEILSWTSGIVVTIDAAAAAYNFAAKAISIPASGVIAMPDDFGGLRSPPVYAHSETYGAGPQIIEADPETILAMWRNSDQLTDASYYAIVGRAFAAATGQRFDMLVAPLPDEARRWNIFYNTLAPDITDSASVYLLGGELHADTILECALAEAEWRTTKTAGIHYQRSMEGMLASIALDRQLFSSAEQKFLVLR